MATSVEVRDQDRDVQYESPEARNDRNFTSWWENAQERADQFLGNDLPYQRLCRGYLALVKDLQGGRLNLLTKGGIEIMNSLGKQMGDLEKIAAIYAPILTGGYPRDLHLPPVLCRHPEGMKVNSSLY